MKFNGTHFLIYLFSVVQSYFDRLFQVICVCITDSDSHNFGDHLKSLVLFSFQPTKEAICKFFKVWIT